MRKLYYFLLLLFLLQPMVAQDSKPVRSVVSSTTLGIGGSDILDTYLTPIDYRGLHVSLNNERLQVAARGKEKRINQQKVWVDYSSNNNRPGNGLVATGFIGYSWGTMWKINLLRELTLHVGPYASGEAGFIYNLRNGNNPASAKLSVEAGGTLMAAYRLRVIPRFPITLRYQGSLPLMSVFFSPHYEQSYYEIFSLGNTDGIVHFGSFNNRFDLNNLLTMDLPVGALNLRLGFLSKIHNTHVNQIKNRRISNSFLIGFSKEFLPFNRKKPNINPNRVISPLF